MSSFWGPSPTDQEGSQENQEEIIFRCLREEFFLALEKEIDKWVPAEKCQQTLSICESVLNRPGDPHKEIRLMKIDNRGSSRCAWEGCNRVTPRRDNAIKDALAQFVYVIIDRDRLQNDGALCEQLDSNLNNLVELGKRLRNAGGNDPKGSRKEMIKAERKSLLKKIRKELKLIKDLSNADTWSGNRSNIMNILEKSRGRNRYCRRHSQEFIKYWMAGKKIPFKPSLTERDIRSRCEEVLFQRIWRYIEARILPLAPSGIARLVVERVAFDMLAGNRQQRLKVGDRTLEQMYQHGPRYGFKNELDLLKTEFGGMCAYCGKSSDQVIERDHILPKSEFIFDSYLNLVPACPTCNRQLKSKRSPGASSLKINEDAYQAYCDYLKKSFSKNPPHQLHIMKKGILNLMRDEKRVWEAEQYLSLIAKNFIEITGTQRGPRPLARYLSEKIRRQFGQIPKVVFHNGRHTFLWRQVAYPNFDKKKDKETGSTINHALDAVILGCDLPSPSALEGLNLPVRAMKSWASNVKKKAPNPSSEGVPVMPPPSFSVPGFEEILQGNYLETNLAFFNWNRKNSRVQRQDLYGWNPYKNVPTKRTAAADLVADLIEADKKSTGEAKLAEVDKIIDNIVHPHLKAALQTARKKNPPGKSCGNTMKNWLQKTIGKSLGKARFSSHPADQSRKKMLEDFAKGKFNGIPAVIGIKLLRPGHKAAVDLARVDKRTGRLIHRYWADPAVIAKIVGYKNGKKGLNRNQPIVFDWRQNWAITHKYKRIPLATDGPLQGRHFGESQINRNDWINALEIYLSNMGVGQYIFVRKGNVTVYEDGSQRYIRNFSSTQGFKNSLLKDIIGVKRSPFAEKVTYNTTIKSGR